MEEESSEDTQTSEFTHDDCNNIACENFIIIWAKQQGFQIIKDRVVRLEVEQHNHPLDVSIVEFEDSRKFTDSMIEDIKFMTVSCKFGATAQRKFLERKYSTPPTLFTRTLQHYSKISTYKGIIIK
ncbi:unnamed protein product [Rhizophagus irregularis]|nr:unnamed protein product [Rhizophagus irregularis]